MAISIPLLSKKQYTFNQAVILNLFGKMSLGSLTLTMPNGEKFRFGNGGNEVCANIDIKDNAFFKKCVLYGDIGFGESYMDGDWETDNIGNVISWFILNRETNPAISGSKIKGSFVNLFQFFNRLYHHSRENDLKGSRENISEHYDLGNDFYSLFLDKSMTYSSGIFREATDSLEQAQFEKYDRLCRVLKMKETDHILEIGSGWGGFAIHAAKNYGCKITTVTISEEQFNYARKKIQDEGLSDRITIKLEDYRNIEGKFDKIVSIEMLEAVGHKYLPTYFKKCQALLKEDGSLALQVITSPDSRYNEIRKGVDFIQKHIFPGSLLPSVAKINRCINQHSNMTLYDIKDIGLDYAKTLNLWHKDFNKQVSKVKALGMDATFIRKWNYYLQYCEAAFKMRNISTLQLVYTKPNNVNL